jgi:predicted permease
MTRFDVAGRERPDGAEPEGLAQWRMISPGYFRVMGIPVLRGRTFTHHDTAEAEPVVIINQALARRYFPDEDPVGQAFAATSPEEPPTRIVGVVGDISEVTLDRPPYPTVFAPAAQAPDGVTAFVAQVMPTCWVVRTSGDPLGYAKAVQGEILAVDPEQPVSSVRTMGQIMSTSIARRQFNTLLLTLFAGLALLLAVVGIYGVMSYSVAQRTREIGVRMALGAARKETLRLILGQGMRLAVIGVVIGILGAFGLTRFLASMLFEIGATDPKTFVGVSLGLLLAAAVACLVPARRATRVDPVVALRHE